MKTNKATKKSIDAALKSAGISAEIVKGNGYFYFSGDSMNLAKQQGVYGVCRYSDLSVERWVDECRDLMT